MRVRLQFASLKETRPSEYLKRFLFGGAVTVLASLIDRTWGPVVGGLFLAFPGIFPPSASLVERHKMEREQQQGKHGVLSARAEASVEAAGASCGAVGLIAFALVLWKLLPHHSPALALSAAVAAWGLTSWLAWFARDHV